MSASVNHMRNAVSVSATLGKGGNSGRRRRAVIVGSLGYSLVNFRLDLMRRFQANGYEVIALAAEIDAETARILDENGIAHREIPMNRTGTNPFSDLVSLWALMRALREEKPELVLAYTMKPIVYACLAAQLVGIRSRYALFTGLGYAFMEDKPVGRRRYVRAASVWLHRIALRRLTAAFCYNRADRRDIRTFRLIPDRVPLHDIPGSGVDTARFSATPVPQGPIRFLFVGRLLRSKGLALLAEAAKRLKSEGHEFELDILGPTDSNPDAIEPEQLKAWQDEGVLRYRGATNDVVPFLHASSVLVLPTSLREGIPRSILEAMSCGRAVITTDAPGCGETIEHGVSGFVVPRDDVEALAGAMKSFIEKPDRAAVMGAAARDLVCSRNDIHLVNARLMQLMGIEAVRYASGVRKPDPVADAEVARQVSEVALS
ncbi:glycosyltransferase family 4 protein [Roseibium aggregatum]|uniref:glycosyltransferase family 4 protein n=1 Tax=Roseibium aggregatum TaxID=187304 RepID=UPI003A973CC4